MDRDQRINAAHEYLLKAELACLQARRLLPEDLRTLFAEEAVRYAAIRDLRLYLEALQPDLRSIHARALVRGVRLAYDREQIWREKRE